MAIPAGDRLRIFGVHASNLSATTQAVIAGAAAFAAWLGVSLIVVADGRRGLAVGVGLTALGLGVLVWSIAGPAAATALWIGGAGAAALRWRSGAAAWNVMPAGSTPRLVMCVAVGLIALWVATSVMSGDGAALRFAVLCVVALSGGRVMVSDEPAASTTAMAALVLALAAGTALATPGAVAWMSVAAAVVAIGASTFPRPAVDPS